jgi:hypothetical protein
VILPHPLTLSKQIAFAAAREGLRSPAKEQATAKSCAKWLAGTIVTKWGDSEAKKHLCQQCFEGDKNHSYWTMKPSGLYQFNKLLFHQYKYSNFQTSLNTLKKSIASDNGQIKFDELTIMLESMAFTREMATSHENPFMTHLKLENHW